MAKQQQTAITPTREQDYPEWYQQVIRAADLAEPSPVRGCMVIKPWGYTLWENMQRVLDGMFKATGHVNAYFPLFIPLSFLQQEADHVEGFATECAVVTHHRLEKNAEGKLVPAAPLEEPLIVRPTSETIIGASFAKWVQSYRDLPLLINQWANVVRWEMRPRLFLRTAEFLWQEGHTVHATAEEAREETLRMLDVYADFAENWMAMPVVRGRKSESERFPGAVDTYAIEAMMQDRKALQAGTSHFLGQNFARASEIRYLSAAGQLEHAWTTSWGVSTRLVGGVVMTHGDDDGLVLPPKLAPAHLVILPVIHKEETKAEVMQYCDTLADALRGVNYHGMPIRVQIDAREGRGGDKVWEWIKRGVPLRAEIGPRDIANDSVFLARRDKPHKERRSVPRGELLASITAELDDIQQSLFTRAAEFRQQHTRKIDDKDEFYAFFTPKRGSAASDGEGPGDMAGTAAGDRESGDKPEIHGGFAMAHWCGDAEVEAQIKRDLNVTIRCIPLEGHHRHFEIDSGEGRCILTGKPSRQRVIWAKAY